MTEQPKTVSTTFYRRNSNWRLTKFHVL